MTKTTSVSVDHGSTLATPRVVRVFCEDAARVGLTMLARYQSNHSAGFFLPEPPKNGDKGVYALEASAKGIDIRGFGHGSVYQLPAIRRFNKNFKSIMVCRVKFQQHANKAWKKQLMARTSER